MCFVKKRKKKGEGGDYPRERGEQTVKQAMKRRDKEEMRLNLFSDPR